jgi:hypothetical protein
VLVAACAAIGMANVFAAGTSTAHAAVPRTHTGVVPNDPPLTDGTRFHENGGSAEYISWFGASLPLSSGDARAYSAEGNKAVSTVAAGYVAAHPASDFPAHKAFRIVGSLSEYVYDGEEILPLSPGDTTSCLGNLGQSRLAITPELWARPFPLGPATTCDKPKALGPFSLVQTYSPPEDPLGLFDAAAAHPAEARPFDTSLNIDEEAFEIGSTLVGDFNGDGRADQLIYGEGDGPDAIWYGTANAFELGPAITVNGDYEPVVGDFNGDGRADVLWYAPDGSVGGFSSSVWYGRPGNAGFLGGPTIPTPPQSTISIEPPFHIEITQYLPLVGDFNGDGRADVYFSLLETTQQSRPPNVVWYGKVTGFNVGTKSTAPFVDDSSPFPLERNRLERVAQFARNKLAVTPSHPTRIYLIEPPSIGDFNGDGKDDLLWYAPGHTKLWHGAGPAAGFTNATVATVYGAYEPVVGDFDGDGSADIFWYAPGPGGDALWRGTGSGFVHGAAVSVSGEYFPVAADYNGDGKTDIFWYDGETGHHHTWFGRASGFTHAADSVTAADSEDDFVLPTAADFNGDGHADLLLYRDHLVETPNTFSDSVTETLWHAH